MDAIGGMSVQYPVYFAVGGDTVEPVALAVAERGKPFFFVSGYGSSGVPDAFTGTKVVTKPCLVTELRSAIDYPFGRSA